MILTVLTSLALALGESSTASPLPATPAEAKMRVERVKQEIAQEEKAWAEEIAREKEAEARRRQRFSEFNQDRLRLQQGLAEQEEKLKGLLGRMETHQYREKELKARFQALNAVLAARAKVLRKDMAKGLPYRLEKRLEALDLVVRDVESGNISPEEAMNRLWAIHQSERRLAQEAEVYSGDFVDEDGGDPVQVKYLRVGKQALAFSSLDGTRLGILRSAPGDSSGMPAYAWVREKDMDMAARQALKHAIATAEGKSVPGFVPLPIWKTSFASAGAVGSAGGKSIGSPDGAPAASAPPASKAVDPAGARRAAP